MKFQGEKKNRQRQVTALFGFKAFKKIFGEG